TYAVQLTQFNLGVEGTFQEFLLLLNPLGSSLLFLGLAFLFKGRKKYIALMIIYLLLSIILFANVVYYRSFTDFITLPVLTHTHNVGDIRRSILTLLKPLYLFFFMYSLFLLGFLVFRFVKIAKDDMNLRIIATVVVLHLTIVRLIIGLAE